MWNALPRFCCCEKQSKYPTENALYYIATLSNNKYTHKQTYACSRIGNTTYLYTHICEMLSLDYHRISFLTRASLCWIKKRVEIIREPNDGKQKWVIPIQIGISTHILWLYISAVQCINSTVSSFLPSDKAGCQTTFSHAWTREKQRRKLTSRLVSVGFFIPWC